jgi:hypothetical protein
VKKAVEKLRELGKSLIGAIRFYAQDSAFTVKLVAVEYAYLRK